MSAAACKLQATNMMSRLSTAHEHMCVRVFSMDKETRVALVYNLYDVGTLMYYPVRGGFHVWCKYKNGLFALLAHRGEHKEYIGFVLLVGGEVVMFFNHFSYPLDWCIEALPTFCIDSTFNNDAMRFIDGL